MAKALTPAERRKLLARPASGLSASELDTRRELIAAGRIKTTPGGKKKKRKKRRINTVGGVASALKGRGTFE